MTAKSTATNPEIQSLIARLGYHREHHGRMELINPDGPEAAAALQSLMEERDRETRRADGLQRRVLELEGKR